MSTVLELESVTKRFGGVTALDDVDWRVNIGETRAIIGPNGAGKSTFFNVVSGQLSPTSGRVLFDGEDISGLSPEIIARKGIVKTFQTTNVFEKLTVFENVRLGAQVRESTYNMATHYRNLDRVAERAEEVLGQLRLEEFRDEVVEDLSHGDQRKVEIGISLAADPEVLLFDEPTAGMSSDEQQNVLDFLRTLSTDTDITIVVTEHDVEFIMNLADEVTVLHQGEIISEGAPEEITSDEHVQTVYLGEE